MLWRTGRDMVTWGSHSGQGPEDKNHDTHICSHNIWPMTYVCPMIWALDTCVYKI